MKCAGVIALVGEYRDLELKSDARLSVDTHLSVCPDCAAFLRSYDKSIEVARALPFDDMPAAAMRRVRQRLGERLREMSDYH